MSAEFEAVIGLEVHCQLSTRSKLFCSCPVDPLAPPNTNICPVCTGQPGALPVPSALAVQLIVKTGLALNCAIAMRSLFARKQYFYPDLPKNYQISQYELPLCQKGSLSIFTNGREKRIGIVRVHLEEDAGKLLHAIGERRLDYSLVDLNRAGTPLAEIVSEPEMESTEEAVAYLGALKIILQYCGISHCDMEKGELRCDANVSIRPKGESALGKRVEVKNMNSFKAVESALVYEISRQKEACGKGEPIRQETRLWDPEKGQTAIMRSKEEAHDYRYFPDPDLPPLILAQDWIEKIRAEIPELPRQRQKRFTERLGLSSYDARVLTSRKDLADYFEKVISAGASAPAAAGWVTTELLGRLSELKKEISESPVSAEALAELVGLIEKGQISGKIGKTVLDEMLVSGKSAAHVVKEKGLLQVTEASSLEEWARAAISENPKAVSEFRAGKEQALMALVGAVMKKSKGLAHPKQTNEILRKLLG